MGCKRCKKDLVGKHRNIATFCSRVCMSLYTREQWVGKRFHRLTILEVLDNRKARCLCDCGNETSVYLVNISRSVPNTTSCGCLWSEVIRKANTTHGYPRKSLTYRTWSMMKARCYIPSCSSYSYYGGKGIKVCDRWRLSFQNFLDDMGPRPSKEITLDRLNGEGQYEPSNCRWATKKEQCSNRRKREKK